jgi:flagellin-specific chaperone FliS
MQRNKTDWAYQSASAEGATQIGLLKLVYDRLAHDLRTAAEAARRNDISARCAASNHALLLLGHLESWVEYLDDVKLSASLRQFYQLLRTRALHLQRNGSGVDFEQLAAFVVGARVAWDTKESELTRRVAEEAEAPSASVLVDSRVAGSNRSHWSA